MCSWRGHLVSPRRCFISQRLHSLTLLPSQANGHKEKSDRLLVPFHISRHCFALVAGSSSLGASLRKEVVCLAVRVPPGILRKGDQVPLQGQSAMGSRAFVADSRRLSTIMTSFVRAGEGRLGLWGTCWRGLGEDLGVQAAI